MKDSLKVLLTCALGAGVCTLTAIQINGAFWWIGLLVGGMVGYLAYEFKKVLQAIPKAWNAVVGWRPNWRMAGTAFLMIMMVGPWAILLFGIMIGIGEGFKEGMMVVSFLTAIFSGGTLLFCIGCLFNAKGPSEVNQNMAKDFWRYNILFICFYHIPIWTIKRIKYILLKIPGFLHEILAGLIFVFKTLAKFIATVFIMIHSEKRVLCAVDSMFGGTIGFIVWRGGLIGALSVLIGAAAGGLIGLANYEFLSKRILRKRVFEYQASRVKIT